MPTSVPTDPALSGHASQTTEEDIEVAARITAADDLITPPGRNPRRDLLGKLEWDPSYDYKSSRSREMNSQQEGQVVVRRAGRCTSGEAHRAVFPEGAPACAPDAKEAIRKYIRRKYTGL